MSLSEQSVHSEAPVSQRPNPKPRVSKPRKSHPNSLLLDQAPQESNKVLTSGNVKNIVSKFNQQDVLRNRMLAESVVTPPKKTSRPPTIKPKPHMLNLHSCASQPPPLPARRPHTSWSSSNDAAVETSAVTNITAVPPNEEESRPAPEGKEVETLDLGTVTKEAEPDMEVPTSPACSKDCTCICHLQRPGMKLVWRHVAEEKDEEEENGDESEEEETKEHVESESEGEEQQEEEEKGAEGGDMSSETEEKKLGSQLIDKNQKVSCTSKGAFRKKHLENFCTSDAGAQGPLNDNTESFSQATSIVRDLSMYEDEEDTIYDDILEPPHAPSIRNWGTKPNKGVHSHSEQDQKSHPNSLGAQEDPPPAIPLRVPLHSSPHLNSGPRGILLLKPSLEDRLNLRPISPLPPPFDQSQNASLVLSQAQQSSPLLPHRRVKEPQSRSSPEGGSLSLPSTQSISQLDNKEERPGDEEGGSKEEEWPPVPLPRNLSKDWKSQFQDEPLYQTYRATVITKEIRRQTVCRNISKTSADYMMDFGAHKGEARGPKGGSGHSTLWQELPAVRASGILGKLSPAEIKYQESMFEVLTSEASYLRSLRVLTDHFLESRELDETLIVHNKRTLFSNILRVREVSERFLMDLEDRMKESLMISDICDIIYYHAQHNFPAYIDYVRNQIYQEKTYTTLMQTNPQFAAVISQLQELPQCQRLPFMSFLLLPFQRITRIKMLIENILKRTKERTKEEQSASKALASVSKIIQDCNTEVGKMKMMEQLICTATMLEFEKLKAIPIISEKRFLEKQGELQEMAKGNTLFTLRPKFIPIYLFLFNDLLILASKKSSDRYVVIDHSHRSLVQVQPISEDSAGFLVENCFCLTLLENHQGRMNERLLKATTQSDMQRWIAVFPNTDSMEKDTNDVVYEDWDCPQVQCIEQYVAKQADELNLEPTDIINILRKTNEGWYQGSRLSDGQKGWFPAANVQEITNEHVRRRNLRERYRLMQAADAITKARTGS